MSITGQTIAVTGASSGLGLEITRQMSAKGAQVVAAARRHERLEALSAETGCEAYALDLCDPEACQAFARSLSDRGATGLILNAGTTYVAPFLSKTDADDDTLIATNIAANVRLLRAVIGDWVKRGVKGRILIVASLAGLTPIPYQAVYSGTKSFMVNLGLALREEVAESGIVVTVFAPGGIATEMTADTQMDPLRQHLQPVAVVAAQAVTAFASGNALVVPGVSNKIAALALRFLPRSVAAKQMERLYRKVVPD